MKTLRQYLIEKAPPGEDAEEWIKKNKERFKKEYGEDWEQILYATAWKMFGDKNESINERVWFDAIAGFFQKHIYHKDYEDAVESLHKVIMKKKAESKKLKHTIEYYAQVVARSYANVNGYDLADVYQEVFPQ